MDLSLTAALRFPGDVLGQIDCGSQQLYRSSYGLVGTVDAIAAPAAYLPLDRPTARLFEPNGSVHPDWTFNGRDQYGAMVDAFAQAVAGGRMSDPAEVGPARMRASDVIRSILSTIARNWLTRRFDDEGRLERRGVA